MLEAWSELPSWLRLTIAFIICGLGALLFWFVSIRAGIALGGLGFAMLMVGGKSQSEKNGYRF